MSLITTMGQPSSPLFLTGEAVTGIDLTGLDYYYKKKEQADENLRKKLADQAPEIKEFDQKINALPGEKTYLYQKYVEKRNKISEGVKKYGGVWAVYVNTPEGRADLAALSENPYDATMADRNYMRWEGAVGDMTKEGTGKNIYLDQNFRPVVYKDKAGRVRYARNEDFLQTQAQEVEFDQNGRLAAKDYSITKGDSEDVTNEIRQFATAVGSSSSESSKPVLGTYFDPNTGTYGQGSSVMGGYDAYNYIMNTQVGSSSNSAQLNDAVGVISNSLSIEAQQGVWQEIYSGAEGKKTVTFYDPESNTEEYVDYKKLDSDENYRNKVYQGYVYKRVKQGVAPFRESSSKSNIGIQVLGKAEGAGINDQKNKNEGYFSLAMQGKIGADKRDPQTTYVYDSKTGKYVAQGYDALVFKNNYADEKLSTLNQGLAAKPKTLGEIGASNFIYQGTNNNLFTNPEMRQSKVTSYNALQTGPPLIKDTTNGGMRTMTAEETTRYQNLAKKDQSKLTSDEKAFMDASTPGMYWNATIVVPESVIDSESGPKMVDAEGKLVDVVKENFWFGINDIQDTEEGSVTVDDDGNYIMQVLIPASRGDALIGASQSQEDQTLNRFINEEQLIIDDIFKNQQQIQQNQQNFQNSLY